LVVSSEQVLNCNRYCFVANEAHLIAVMLTVELELRAAEAEDDFMIPGTFWARIEH